MSKIDLNPLTSGLYTTAALNSRLQQIEDALNNDLLWKDNPVGEDNTMEGPLDMGDKQILNVADGVSDSDAVNVGQISHLVSESIADLDVSLGNVMGADSSEEDQVALFSGTTGRLLKAGQTMDEYLTSFLPTIVTELKEEFVQRNDTISVVVNSNELTDNQQFNIIDNGSWYYDADSVVTENNARGVYIPTSGIGRILAQKERVGIPNEHTNGGVVVNDADYAVLGSNLMPALSSFTKSNFDASGNHTAGTAGSMSVAVTGAAFSYWILKVSVTTVISGRVNFKFGGVNFIGDQPNGYYFSNKSVYTDGLENNRVMDSTTFWFAYETSGSGFSTFEVLTDTSWEGSVSSVELYKPNARKIFLAGAGSGVNGVNNPIGGKAGSYNRNDIAYGDKFTMGSFIGDDGSGMPIAASNTFFGAKAGASLLYGDENTGVGTFALQYCEGSDNYASGYSALKLNTKGQENTAAGYKASTSNTIGSKGASFGFHAHWSAIDSFEWVSVGWLSGSNATGGDFNTYLGSRSGMMNLDGDGNTYVGALAGYGSGAGGYSFDYTTNVGFQAMVYGNNGVAIGFNSRAGTSASNVDNTIAIGANVQVAVANTAKIGKALDAVVLSGRSLSKNTYNGVSNAAGVTYTTSQFFGSVIERSGPAGSFSDTTPTATDLLALIPDPEVGTGYDLHIRNLTANTLTILAGSGVTLSGTTTVAGNKTRFYKVRVNSLSPAAIGVYGISASDN